LRLQGIGEEETLLTVVISPRHLAHSMDKRTRANDNGDVRAMPDHAMTRVSRKKCAWIKQLIL
jgi:hypothetical protein